MDKNKKFLSIKEAAEFTGLSTNVLRRAIRDGAIPAIKTAKYHLINKRELMKALHMEEDDE